MFLIPLLAGNIEFELKEIIFIILKAVTVIALIFILSRLLIPKLLYHIAKVRSKDLFLLTIICICLVIAGLTAYVGLSLAIGAFIAGLIISESADVGNPLAAERGYQHHVSGTHIVRREAADLNAAAAVEDDVALGYADQPMPPGRASRFNPRPGDGYLGVLRCIGQLGD